MTTAAAQPPAHTPDLQPRPPRTSGIQADATAPPKSRTSHTLTSTGTGAQPEQAGGPRRGARAASTDPLSDKATAFLIRRILCPQQADKGRSSPASIEDVLPPLTSRNDVDLQLYALIAILLREYVQNWYAKITPDETFVAEIVQVIAHITRALEQRLRKVDLESLLFDEIPELFDKHVTAYRVAHDAITQPPVGKDPREIYHSLCPLPALSPVPRPDDPESVAAQAENETAYRQLLVYAFLAILLPTEDLENSCLAALVGQILSELIIGNTVAGRLSEPWLIWELLIIASRTTRRPKTAEGVDRSMQSNTSHSAGRRVFSVHALFWAFLQWCFLAVSFIKTAFAILVTSGSLPRRVPRDTGVPKGQARHPTSQETPRLSSSSKTPVLAFRCWSAVSNLSEMDKRMPWLCGALSLLQWIAVMGPGRIAGVDGRLDRLLSYGIHRHVLDAANLSPLLRSVRGALFPNNMPAGKPALVAPSSDAELRALRRRCASALWALVPKRIGRLYFGGGLLLRAIPVWRRTMENTEGYAELKAAGSNSSNSNKKETTKRDNGNDSAKRDYPDRGSLSSSLLMREVEPAAAAQAAQMEPMQARGRQEGTRSESQSGSSAAPPRPHSPSWRSAPAPRPKTGGQGPLDDSASAGADPPPPPPSNPANIVISPFGEDGDGVDNDTDADADAEDEVILEEIERTILDVFSDAYCNKHLVYSTLELILVRLLPELTEKRVWELWEERVPVEV